MFRLSFELVSSRIFPTANIVPSLIKLAHSL